MKKSVLISGSESTKIAVMYQLREFISPLDLTAIASEEGLPARICCDLLIVSSARMMRALEESGTELDYRDLIVCKRGIHYERIERIAQLAPGTDVLLVNDEPETVAETIDELIALGLNHVSYHPYYPGIPSYPAVALAVTPGEIDKVPDEIEEIVDIGPRILDIESMFEIAEKLTLDIRALRRTTHRFFGHLLNVSRNMAQVQRKVNTLNRHLNQIIGSLVGGILVFDTEGRILHINSEMMKMLGIRSVGSGAKNIKNYVSREMLQRLFREDNIESESVPFMGAKVILSKFFLADSSSFVVTTRYEDGRSEAAEELRRKGHIAKYRFEDIVGRSEAIVKAKRDAERLARSDLSILIEGESGTGKELFASAIHNSSPRAGGPFLAVNCSAFPDELIESELFGYEEGAFTGAKKGGRTGLFELAEGGTLFLDEIGDMSQKVQTRLLRVLQEKEIRPIGSSVIKKVDVRVVAATNRNLARQVELGTFRADLYYRLKVGYIELPPLRERVEDIVPLAEIFVRKEVSGKISFEPEVIEALRRGEWRGNARELENTIKYMLAVRSGDLLRMEDLPGKSALKPTGSADPADPGDESEFEKIPEPDLIVLDAVYQLYLDGKGASRSTVCELLNGRGADVTVSQIRNRLRRLAQLGYVVSSRGRGGSQITRSGIETALRRRGRSLL